MVCFMLMMLLYRRGEDIFHTELIRFKKSVLETPVDWGFKFSIKKIKGHVFYMVRKKVPGNLKIMLYNHPFERGEKFKCIGVWF